MTKTFVNDSGTFREVKELYVKDAGSWRNIDEVYVKESGDWRLVHKRRPDLISSSGTISFDENANVYDHGPYGGPPVDIYDSGGVSDYRNDNNDGLDDFGPFTHMFSTFIKIADEPIPAGNTVEVTINSMDSRMRIVNWNDIPFFKENNLNVLTITNTAPNELGANPLGTSFDLQNTWSLAQRRDDNAWASGNTVPSGGFFHPTGAGLSPSDIPGGANTGFDNTGTANSGTIEINSFFPANGFGISSAGQNPSNYVQQVRDYVNDTDNHSFSSIQVFIVDKSRSFPFTASYDISVAYKD